MRERGGGGRGGGENIKLFQKIIIYFRIIIKIVYVYILYICVYI